MMEHTKEPWHWIEGSEKTNDRAKLIGANGDEVCNFGNCAQYYPTDGTEPSDDDKIRIVMAVNACREASNEDLADDCVIKMRADRDDAIRAIGIEATLRGKAESERDAALAMVSELTAASKAVIERWRSPKWEWHKQGPTGDLINELGRVVTKAEASMSESPRGSHFRDDHGIQLNTNPFFVENEDSYRAKLSRVNVPVIIKTGDQADALRELVHGIKLADKHLEVQV